MRCCCCSIPVPLITDLKLRDDGLLQVTVDPPDRLGEPRTPVAVPGRTCLHAAWLTTHLVHPSPERPVPQCVVLCLLVAQLTTGTWCFSMETGTRTLQNIWG